MDKFKKDTYKLYYFQTHFTLFDINGKSIGHTKLDIS
jgi:hypothetical protein